MSVQVRVPATTANLGPGLDVLGMALDMWNEAVFTITKDGEISVSVQGKGAGLLPEDDSNTVAEAAMRVYEHLGKPCPGLRIVCHNEIPLGSGMGSSSAAILTGILGANALLGNPLSQREVLQLAAQMEGHPDNIAPALLGGLVVSYLDGEKVVAEKLPMESGAQRLSVTVVLPDFSLPTSEARAILPGKVGRAKVVANLGRVVLVVEALRRADLELLREAMRDQLHQPYRIPLIPGAAEALKAAQKLGAAAALSGAGPSLIAFTAEENKVVGKSMRRALIRAGLSAQIYSLRISEKGASVDVDH